MYFAPRIIGADRISEASSAGYGGGTADNAAEDGR
jgi:hypothetical protein